MKIASTKNISEGFLSEIDRSVVELKTKNIGVMDQLKLRNGIRYARADQHAATRAIKDFFEHEFAEMNIEQEPFEADYHLEFENDKQFLNAKIRLSTRGRAGGTWYGMSVRRVGPAKYILDKEGFFDEIL